MVKSHICKNVKIILQGAEMARITFEVTQEQHTYIKMMAASKGISIRDYFLAQIERSIPAGESKKLNRKTRKVLEDTNRHQNIHFTATIPDFYEELGLSQYIEEKHEGLIGGIIKSFIPHERAQEKVA